jgi:hypothetical protein
MLVNMKILIPVGEQVCRNCGGEGYVNITFLFFFRKKITAIFRA